MSRAKNRGVAFSTEEILWFMVISGAIAGVYLVLRLANAVSEGALRAWLALSFVILPVAFGAGWRLGTRDSRAHLSGLDKGVDRVMSAADRVSGLRVSNIGRVREARKPAIDVTPLALPDPEIRMIRASQQEVIDL